MIKIQDYAKFYMINFVMGTVICALDEGAVVNGMSIRLAVFGSAIAAFAFAYLLARFDCYLSGDRRSGLGRYAMEFFLIVAGMYFGSLLIYYPLRNTEAFFTGVLMYSVMMAISAIPARIIYYYMIHHGRSRV